MRKTKKILSLAIATMIALSCMCMTAFATDGSDTTPDQDLRTYLSENIESVGNSSITPKSGASWITTYFTTDQSKASTENPFSVAVGSDGKEIYLKKEYTVDDAVKKMSTTIKNGQTTKQVETLTDGLNVGADTGAATVMMKGFIPILSMVLGVIVTLITLGMTVYSAFDIAYIAFPVFRNKCEDAKVNGGAMAKTKSNGETKLRFVTDDAQYAVQQGSVETGKSPWTIYFRKRVMSYIMLAIILFILMTGNISLITNIAINVVSGIMDVLASLA